MTLSDQVVKNIITKLINGEDYRIEIVTLINAEFLQYVIQFFKKIVDAKLKNDDITIDWYKKEFLQAKLPTEEIIINAGLNKKTISNMYNSASKQIVLDAANEHYDTLYESIKALVKTEQDINVTLTIKLRGISIDLNVSESLIVINTIAVKRAALRGGLWSTAGKRVEKALMLTLCKLFAVPSTYYNQELLPTSLREIDFYLINKEKKYRCEVKLMGKGNPESADAVIARDSDIFVADKLSELNKKQLDSLGLLWVELRSQNGFMKFGEILTKLQIPHTQFKGNSSQKLDEIYRDVFQEVDKTISSIEVSQGDMNDSLPEI